MVERSAAVSETGRATDGVGHVLLGKADSLGDALSEREVGRDSGGQCAAGAVGRGAVELLDFEAVAYFAVK